MNASGLTGFMDGHCLLVAGGVIQYCELVENKRFAGGVMEASEFLNPCGCYRQLFYHERSL